MPCRLRPKISSYSFRLTKKVETIPSNVCHDSRDCLLAECRTWRRRQDRCDWRGRTCHQPNHDKARRLSRQWHRSESCEGLLRSRPDRLHGNGKGVGPCRSMVSRTVSSAPGRPALTARLRRRGKGGTGRQKITKRSRGWGILMIFAARKRSCEKRPSTHNFRSILERVPDS